MSDAENIPTLECDSDPVSKYDYTYPIHPRVPGEQIDVTVRYDHTHHGYMTLEPDFGVPIGGHVSWPGKRTLEFNLAEDQFLPIGITQLKMELRLYRDKIEMVPVHTKREPIV